MKISVKKAAPDVFALSFDEVEVALDGDGLKTLLRHITQLIAPDAEARRAPDRRLKEFLRHVKNANDLGLQKFLLVADHQDVLLLLKLAENDEALLRKLYGNVSERAHKILAEDLAFKARQGVSEAEIGAALGRLMAIARELEAEGTLVYENVHRR